ERHFEHLLVIGGAYVGRYFRKACKFGSAEATFAANQLIGVARRLSHGDRLDQSLELDGVCQFAKCVLIEVGSRLEWVDDDFCDGDRIDAGWHPRRFGIARPFALAPSIVYLFGVVKQRT